MLIPVRPPYLVRRFYNRFVWRMPGEDKKLYLTFDDGPVPGPTEFVLDTLASFNAKATFFCIGKNIHKHPGIYEAIIKGGHQTGSHTYNHLNGWQHTLSDYIEDFQKCDQVMQTDLFRPPYGRIRLAQAASILQTKKIIMWDVLSYDFDKAIGPRRCLANVSDNARPGSIIVFHDSDKAFKNLKYALPLTLQYFTNKGYTFEKINPD